MNSKSTAGFWHVHAEFKKGFAQAMKSHYWSAQGFKAGIKSRWLSALDLLGARRVAASNVAAERQTSISQALTAAHVGLISAARQAVEKEVADDPKLAAKLLMALGRAEQDAENIGGALDFALQDLRNDPASGAAKTINQQKRLNLRW